MTSKEFLNLKKTMKKKRIPKPTLSDDFSYFLNLFGEEAKEGVEQEYQFHKTRRWRFDFAWPSKMVAVECDGMVWQAGGGRHNTDADRDKINNAVKIGWRVLRFSGKQIKSDPVKCIELLKSTLGIIPGYYM